MTEPAPPPYVVRAKVNWAHFGLDIWLIALALVFPIASFVFDAAHGKSDLFARSGAVTALLAAFLAYRSLSRHYAKFFNNTQRGYPLATSTPQSIVDRITFALSVAGTLIWAYGDKLQ